MPTQHLARFWAEVLDGYQVRPYDELEVARLTSLGAVVQRELDGHTVLHDPEGNKVCVTDRPIPGPVGGDAG